MIQPQPPDRLVATYRLRCATYDAAMEIARDIAREQTLEVPPGVVGGALEERLLGRVDELTAHSEGCFDAKVSYGLEVTGTDFLQVVNVAYGNVSLMNGVRLVDLVLPDEVLEALPGPRFGIEGLREMVGAEGGRPLISVAIKPIGRTPRELADLATTFARAGVDAIKDDHGLVDQSTAPFLDRVAAVGTAVAAANAETGGRTAYFPNVTGPVDQLGARLDLAGRVYDFFVALVPVVFDVTLADTDLAKELLTATGGVSARDCVHGAVMVNNGVQTIATFDRGFDRLGELVRLDLN